MVAMLLLKVRILMIRIKGEQFNKVRGIVSATMEQTFADVSEALRFYNENKDQWHYILVDFDPKLDETKLTERSDWFNH